MAYRHRRECGHNGRVSESDDGWIDGIATRRECVFSVLIVGVLIALGCLVHSKISSAISDHNTKIQQAVRFSDDAMFSHCLETSPGDAFCEGDLDAIDVVTDEKGHIGGEFWTIVREYQEYRMHTRTVHYTTGTGKHKQTHTRTEYYWTWDTIDTHRKSCSFIRFCNVKFPKRKINFKYWPDYNSTISLGHNKRYVYRTIPKHHHGTVFTTFENKTIKDNSPFYSGMNPEQVAEYKMASMVWIWMFWVVATIVIASAVIGFAMLNNRWLEDGCKKKGGIDIGDFFG